MTILNFNLSVLIIMRKNYQQDKFFALYSAVFVIITFFILSIFTQIIGNTPSPFTCSITLFFLSISKFTASLAAAFSTAFFTSYLDSIGIIYIGRGDKLYFQSLVGLISFVFTFFFVFGRFSIPPIC